MSELKMKSLGGSTQQDFTSKDSVHWETFLSPSSVQDSFWSTPYRIPQSNPCDFRGIWDTLGAERPPTVTGCETKCKSSKAGSNLSATPVGTVPPGTICLLPALQSDLKQASFSLLIGASVGWKGPGMSAGGAQAAGTGHAFVCLMWCWNIAGSCLDSRGYTCLQLGRGRKHQCPGRTGFYHVFVNPHCQPCAWHSNMWDFFID